MGKQFSLPGEMKIVSALQPATDAAGRTGSYVSLKGAHKAAVIANVNQGNAATVQLSLVQAQDLSGTGAKALNGYYRANLDVSTSDTLAVFGNAASYTTDVAVKGKMVVIEVDPSTLDIANGYSCIAVVTGASNVANITAASFVLGPLRYSQQTPPSAQA